MGLEMILQTLDADGDGFVGVGDIQGMGGELGVRFPEGWVEGVMERCTGDGARMSKGELGGVFWL